MCPAAHQWWRAHMCASRTVHMHGKRHPWLKRTAGWQGLKASRPPTSDGSHGRGGWGGNGEAMSATRYCLRRSGDVRQRGRASPRRGRWAVARLSVGKHTMRVSIKWSSHTNTQPLKAPVFMRQGMVRVTKLWCKNWSFFKFYFNLTLKFQWKNGGKLIFTPNFWW